MVKVRQVGIGLLLVMISFWAARPSFGQQEGDSKEESKDRKAITKTIQNYFEGYDKGNVELLKKAFDQGCVIKFLDLRKKTYGTLTMKQLNNFMNNLPDGWKSVPKIFWIKNTSNTAIAKVSVTVMGGRLTWTDYVSLLKIDGNWKIYCKISHGDLKGRSSKGEDKDESAKEKAAIKKAIQLYLDGHGKADSKLIGQAFHPDCIIKYSNPFNKGKYSEIKQDDFRKMIDKLPKDWKSESSIEFVDFHKTAGAAKVILKTSGGKVTWTDYLGLLKIDGKWKIVTKVAEGLVKE